jgi:hypothetical protein
VPYGPPEGLSAQFISTVAGGAGDAIWVGTWRSSLHLLRQGVFERQNLPGGDLTNLIRTMAFAPDGSFWHSDFYGLTRSTGGRRTNYTGEQLGRPPSTHAMIFDRRARLWLGNLDGLLEYRQGLITAPGISHLRNRAVRCLLETRDGPSGPVRGKAYIGSVAT